MCSKVCCTWQEPSGIRSNTIVLQRLVGMQRKDLPPGSMQAWQWPSNRMWKDCLWLTPTSLKTSVLCSNEQLRQCFLQAASMKTNSNMGKQNDKRKRKPRRRTCRHTDAWLAYLLGVRLVHCLCWQEEHQQPYKNSEQCIITPSSSSTKGIARYSLTGQAMDAATTPHSQTGNAESYKEASGLADLQCLDYDQAHIKVLGALWTKTGREQCSVVVNGPYKIDPVILLVFSSFVPKQSLLSIIKLWLKPCTFHHEICHWEQIYSPL